MLLLVSDFAPHTGASPHFGQSTQTSLGGLKMDLRRGPKIPTSSPPVSDSSRKLFGQMDPLFVGHPPFWYRKFIDVHFTLLRILFIHTGNKKMKKKRSISLVFNCSMSDRQHSIPNELYLFDDTRIDLCCPRVE